MLKKFPSNKIKGTNALFFLSRSPTHLSFIFDFRFLYELKDKARLSKTVCEIFHVWFRFAFIKAYIFVHQNTWALVIVPFKIKIIEKPHTALLTDLWFLNCNKKFSNSLLSAWVVGASQKWTCWQIFKIKKSI